MMAPEHEPRPFAHEPVGGPLHIGDASQAIREAAEQGKRTAARAEVLIDLAIEMLTALRKKWGWLIGK